MSLTSPAKTARRSGISRASSASRPGVRSSTASFAPSSRNRSTIARPRPDAPPVISTTSSVSAPICRGSLEQRAHVGGRDHRLVEEDVSPRQPEPAVEAPQHVLAPADPAADLGVESGAIEVEADLDRDLVALDIQDADVGDEVARAGRRILGPGRAG